MQPQVGPAPTDSTLPYEPYQRPTQFRYVVMLFLGLLAFLTYFDRVCIAWAQEFLERDLHITDQQMGWILGIFWGAYALFEIPGGWLADRYGARRALSRIVLAWSLFTALSGSATGFYSLFVYRFMFGVGEAGAYPSMAKVQSRWLPMHSRAWFGGILWMLSRWGGAFSPVIFAGMMGIFQTQAFKHFTSTPGLHWLGQIPAWRLGFWMAGLLGVVWVSLFFPWFRDEPEQKAGVNQGELNLIKVGRTARDEGHHLDKTVFRQLFTSQPMWIVAGIGLLVSYCFSFWVSWLPKYLKAVQGLDLKQSKWLGVLPMLFMGLSCLITGRISDWVVQRTGQKRLGRAFLPVAGLCCSAGALIAIQHARTPTQAMIFLCIAAYCVDMNQPCHWANIVDIGGRYAAMAFGFMNMVGNIGNAVAPIINERLFNVYGWNVLFTVNAIILVTSTSFWFFNNPHRRFYEAYSYRPMSITALLMALLVPPAAVLLRFLLTQSHHVDLQTFVWFGMGSGLGALFGWISLAGMKLTKNDEGRKYALTALVLSAPLFFAALAVMSYISIHHWLR